jgi:hypothetical protein
VLLPERPRLGWHLYQHLLCEHVGQTQHLQPEQPVVQHPPLLRQQLRGQQAGGGPQLAFGKGKPENMEDKISSQRVPFSRLLSQPGLGKRTLWKRSGDILVFNVPEIV